MITNCNCAIEIDCGCTVAFDTYSDNLYSALSVGNLVGGGCTLDAYVIDWFRDGTHAMTSGKGVAGLDAYHPFTDGAAIPVQAGVWTPVLRYVVMEGEMVFPVPRNCVKWCRDLQAELPVITVKALGCDIVAGSPASGYTFRIRYTTSQDYSFATRTIRFDLPQDGSARYLAAWFVGYTVVDRVQIFYNDEPDPILDYYVGTDFAATEGSHVPPYLDLNDAKFVANFSDREYLPGDYLIIKVTPSSNPNTQWSLDLKCLGAGAFDCSYFPLSLRDIDLGNVSMAYDAINCKYLLSFPMEIRPTAYNTSNLAKYISLATWKNTNDAALNETTGVVTLALWDKIFCTGEALHTHYHVNSAGLVSYAKVGNIFTFTFEHQDDYSAYKNWYNSNRVNWKFSSYNPDPTHINHYKIFQITWQETATRCGDVYTYRQIYFHWLSPVTFDDQARTMVIELVDITNQYPDEQPRQKCDNTWDTINTLVNACQSTKTAVDWSGSTRCREGRPINGIWIYQQVWNNMTKDFIVGYGIPVRQMLNVCEMDGWWEYPAMAYEYQFQRLYARIEITNPDDRVNNYRISSQLDRETGEDTGVWTRIYEVENGIKIYP